MSARGLFFARQLGYKPTIGQRNRVVAASNFRTSLALVLAHEGGYVNHPADPGGATNRGVTQKVYDSYRDYMRLKRQSVKFIADSEVSDIYNKQYWRPIKGDSLPCGIDYAVFDFGVNSGVSRAVKFLQRLAGVTADGIVGMVTLAAVERHMAANEEQFIGQYCANRLAFVKSLRTFKTFGRGWTRRIIGYQPGVQLNDTGVLDYAIKMARRDTKYLMPTPIGNIEGEVAGQAVPLPDEPELIVEAPPVKGKTLEEINEELAALVAAG